MLPDALKAADPLPALQLLDEPELIQSYLRDALAKDVTLDPGQGIVSVIARRGWESSRADLMALFKPTGIQTIERNVGMLVRLCLAASRAKTGEKASAIETCRAAAEEILAAMIRIDKSSEGDYWPARDLKRAPLISAYTQALLAAQFDDLLKRMAAHLAETPKRYPLRTVQVPALLEAGAWAREHHVSPSPALSAWIQTCETELQSLTAAIPQPPQDFRRDRTVSCKCDDCGELNRFLFDPAEAQHSFQMAEKRRLHLQSNIEGARCDLACKTDKRPRPQVLVCTKTTASHDQRLKEYHENMKFLADLRSLEAALPH